MSHQRIKGNTDCRGIAQLDAIFKSVSVFFQSSASKLTRRNTHTGGREGKEKARVVLALTLPIQGPRKRGYDTIRTAGQHPSTDYGYGSITVKPANPILHQAGFSLTSLPMPRDSSDASTWERVGSEAAVGQASEPGAASDNSSTISQGEHVRFLNPLVRNISPLGGASGRKEGLGLSGRPTQQGTILDKYRLSTAHELGSTASIARDSVL
ncbi:hypothetical protein N5P37_003198 [Trichoderma harzianum]|uniref:Uncharacterized protein n=1 Tax=Trichoderma harzianum CBS 226.95 TaxID=983964 RepID=A0A2T4ATL9_TRIHA|nr:hypothetical protein M431DRAFT_476906 [Trichoderma harzianum CBS 226.95]KAK0763811.1 hypothetical protein N5P37_003198 [Trichoderma harzianum]PKK45612.1 hypothetical protein CI102_7379 [Trichoderma harzianum]PTB60410.1 hypothetical protein M431DRAFT_476906 [Trichoderma harzianum CBS 226.95]